MWFEQTSYSPRSDLEEGSERAKEEGSDAHRGRRSGPSAYGAYRFDLANGAAHASERLKALIGLPALQPSQWDKGHCPAWVYPEDRARVATSLARAIADPRGSYLQQYRVAHSDGSLRQVIDCGQILGRHNGKDFHPTGISGVLLEVAEAVPEGAALGGTYRWDLATSEVHLDKAMAGLVGIAPASVVVLPDDITALLHPKDHRLFLEHSSAQADGQPIREVEYRLLLADGSVRWILDGRQTVFGNDGKRTVVGACLDVTAQKRPRQGSLAEDDHLSAALSQGEMGTWEMDLQTLQVIPSAGAEALCGFQPQPERSLASYLKLIHPADRPSVTEILREPPSQFRVEVRIFPHDDRGLVWIAVQGERRQGPAGHSDSLTGAVSDISPLKRAERLLQVQTLELEGRVRELNCLYTVSRLVQQQERIETLLARVVQLIPGGFAKSDTLSVQLSWGAKQYRSTNFLTTPCVIAQDLKAQGKTIGKLEIFRRGNQSMSFSRAEEALVRALCKPISRAIERKQVLQALSESEDRWRAMADAIAEGLVLYDRDGRVDAWNTSAAHLLGSELVRGVKTGFLHGQTIREDGSPFPVAEYPVLATLQTGCVRDEVIMGLRQKSGAVRWLALNSRPLFHTGEQTPYGAVLSFADISERKQTEETIRREIQAKELERNRLNTVLEALPVAVFIADEDGRILQVNKAVEEMWGAAPLSGAPAIYHRDYQSRWPTTDWPVQAYESGLARTIEHGESVIAEEMEIQRQDGSTRTILNYALPFHGPDGSRAGGVGVSVDITERKQSERERALLAGIVEASPDSIISTDMEGRITSWNAGAERMYGYSAEEVQGQSISILMPPDRMDELAVILSAIAKGKGVTYFDSTRLHKNGTGVEVSVAVTPITDSTGRVRGAAKIDRDITDRKEMEEQLQHDALHDRLTGVANRSLFMDRLEHVVARAERFGERYALFVMDVDNFKLINDTYGHQVGDQLLCAFVARIQDLLRPVDTLARFGGDEFIVLLEETEDQDAVNQIANRILAALQTPFQLDEQLINISSSIGIMFSDSAYSTADQALRNADVALYEAKRQGKNQFVMFDARMRGEQASRLYLESELRRALQEVDLTVQYQPIYDLQIERTVGCEALVRWKHLVMGEVDPARFINVAEDTGLITPLGRFVLDRACSALGAWLENPGFPADFYISVNVSPKEFYAKDLVSYIKTTLEKYGLSGTNLRLEITENVIIQHDREAAAILTQLRATGICISLDDFGTGYSSLSYLHQLPLDVIKIDRSFIQPLAETRQSREIVRSILGLANALDMEAVAEGAETEEQLAEVRALGFRWVQGYMLHSPLNPDDLQALFPTVPDPRTLP